jgi:porphobilinogen synthase
MPLPHRPRRLRQSPGLRRMVRETRLAPENLGQPLFVVDGKDVAEPIDALPGQFRFSIDRLAQEARELLDRGIPAVALFPRIPDQLKDPRGTHGADPDGLFPRAIRAVKMAVPEMLVISDVALDPYSSDCHDGVVENGRIDNDQTVEILADMATVHADAGADIVAPSDMMDGRVAAIRHALDIAGHTDTLILSYAAKYASALYGPFRDALDSAPRQRGGVPTDKRTYQMDPANAREAIKEVMLDVEEGADMVMVKPALAYLDVIRQVRDSIDVPVAAYHVSGEYAMIHAAASRGWADLRAVALEHTLAIRRAGADIILTYFAKELAGWLADD